MPHLVPHGEVKLFFWSSFTEDKRDLEGDQISEEVRFSFQLTHVPSRIEAVQLIGAYPIAYIPLFSSGAPYYLAKQPRPALQLFRRSPRRHQVTCELRSD